MRVFLSAAALWLVMLVIAVIGGAVRDKLLAPRIGEHLARQVETVALAVVFAIGIAAYVWRARLTAAAAAVVGCAWCAATVAFETVLGRVILEQSWSEVLPHYNLAAGRLWPIVLVVLLVTPYAVARWRHD